MTYEEIKANIRDNLEDTGIKFYTEDDLIVAIEDAESDIAFLSRNLIRKVNVDFRPTPYYNFKELGVLDWLCTIAIFDNVRNRWLLDNLTYRDLDKLRDDWELWVGSPSNWCPVSLDITAIVPYQSNPTGNFTLYYAAAACDSPQDDDSPLIATSFQSMIENHATSSLLEQQEEFTKAGEYFEEFFNAILEYQDRVKNQARRDLLIHI